MRVMQTLPQDVASLVCVPLWSALRFYNMLLLYPDCYANSPQNPQIFMAIRQEPQYSNHLSIKYFSTFLKIITDCPLCLFTKCEPKINLGKNKNHLRTEVKRRFYFFSFLLILSINSSSVNAASGRLLTKANVFFRPGPQ